MMDDTLIALDQAIQNYLEWMTVNGYAKSTQQDYRRVLRHFRAFINLKRYRWDKIFTRRTLNRFKRARGIIHVHAVTGLSRYLHAQGEIARPIRVRKSPAHLAYHL
jgi:site-specific recombinase XerD